jgi:hypothetical protein
LREWMPGYIRMHRTQPWSFGSHGPRLRRLPMESGAIDSDDHIMVGKFGRVTGTIRPGHIGEVSVEVRGGVEMFLAHGSDDEIIERYKRVVIVEYFPPRTVVVSPA